MTCESKWNPQKLGNFKLQPDAEYQTVSILYTLRPRLPHDLHDYIIEGLCKAVDGVHVLLVVKTGGGKMGLSYG